MAPSIFFCLQFLCLALTIIGTSAQGLGSWQTLNNDVGIAAMHAAVTRWNTVILLDRTNIGPSNLTFPQGQQCRMNPNDMASTNDCTAHSVAFDLASNTVRALKIETDTWCSSGQFLPNGSLLQSGGWNFDGSNKFRMFDSCINTGSCDWYEFPNTTLQLNRPRWYATNQILPDGSIIIVGGISENSVEYYPPRGGAVNFPFLGQMVTSQGDNLYPYVHLLPNGYLFVFANTQYVLYDYTNNKYITNNLPALVGGPRNYPSAGSSCMLPLEDNYSTATIVICGGAQPGAFNNAKTTLPGQKSCGRINPTDPNPVWEMDNMPEPRIMGEMVMLPTGDVIIINGARAGSQGFELATSASLSPFLYQPKQPLGSRFTILNPTTIGRVYHCTANLLPDGRIMVAGSNTHWGYTWTQPFPTELRVEAFSPDYLSAEKSNLRPIVVNAPTTIKYGDGCSAYVKLPSSLNGAVVEVNFASAPYSTHSFSQGQRLVKSHVTQILFKKPLWQIKFKAPPNSKVVPPGYYMMFVVNQGVPSFAHWVQFTT